MIKHTQRFWTSHWQYRLWRTEVNAAFVPRSGRAAVALSETVYFALGCRGYDQAYATVLDIPLAVPTLAHRSERRVRSEIGACGSSAFGNGVFCVRLPRL